MNTNNKQLGTLFEKHFCGLLSEKGFWVHLLTQNQTGQPADVIAAKNGKTYLIDCKVCSERGFSVSRIEENQELAMTLWKNCNNGEGWFAIALATDNSIYMLTLAQLKKVKALMSNKRIKEEGIPIEIWVRDF